MNHELDLTADIIDVRDIIARVEELDSTREGLRAEFDSDDSNAGVDFDRWVCTNAGSAWSREEEEELASLTAILDDIAGNGGDEKWRGAWYPVTLVRDSYFVEYTKDLLEELEECEIPSWIEIDWHKTARNVLFDYTGTEIEGVTYWYR